VVRLGGSRLRHQAPEQAKTHNDRRDGSRPS
jgi:hypothetical protein